MSLRQRTIQATVWAFVQQIGTQIINFGVSFILTRLLEPADYGLLGILSVFIALGSVLVQGGMNTSIIRTKDPDVDDYVSVFTLNVLIAICVYAVIFFICPYIAAWLEDERLTKLIRVYSLTIIIQSFSAMQVAKLTKELKFKKIAVIQAPSIILSSIVGIYMAYSGYGVWSLVIMLLLQSSLATIQYWIKSDLPFRFGVDKVKLKHHFNFGYKLMLSSLLNTAFQNIYTFFIGKMYNFRELGFYTRAMSLRQLPVHNISMVFNNVTFSVFSEIQDDDKKLKDTYKRTMSLVLFVIAPVLLSLMVVAEPFFRLVFTEKWLPAAYYFQVLCIDGVLYPLHQYNLNILNVKGRSDFFLKLEIIKKIIIAIGIFIVIPYGVEGIVWFQVGFSAFSYFINSYYSGKLINFGLWEQIKDISPILGIATITTFCTYLFDRFILGASVNDFWRIVCDSMIFVAMYFSLAYLLRISSFFELKRIVLRK